MAIRARTATAALVVASVSALLASPVHGASFGVPPAANQPANGWFALVGKDAFEPAEANYYGDVTRELHLFIEVTGTDLKVCIYDPGLFNAAIAGPQLDFQILKTPGPPFPPPGQMTFELYAPGNPVPIAQDRTTWGADTQGPPNPSNNALWCFYDSGPNGATPGTYELYVRLLDGPGSDPDVNIFGVEATPFGNTSDYAAYVYDATLGHSTFTGASLATGAVTLYPWAVEASRGKDKSGVESCGLGVITYDLDAPVVAATPPVTTILTRLGWTDADLYFKPSINGGFRLDDWPNMAGLNAGDDHGIYRLEMSKLTGADGVREANQPPAFDFNAYSLQVYSYGQTEPILFADYPVSPKDPLKASYRPRRLYLPTRTAAAPIKEYLTHVILNPPAGGDFSVGVKSQITVELRIENPTTYALTNVRGATTVITSPAVSLDPLSVTASGGIGASAAATGSTIDFQFTTLPPRAVGLVRYSVDFTPLATGFLFLTGDGSDFLGGLEPTYATWDTPFALQERGGPCMIQTRAVPAPCTMGPVPTGPARVCRNDSFKLDGIGSTQLSCPSGQLEYRFTGPGLPPSPPFATVSDVTVPSAPSGIQTYTLEVRCLGTPTCSGTKTIDVDVSSAVRPTAVTGGDRSVGACDLPVRLGAPGNPVQFTYAWSTTGPNPIAQLLDDPAAADPNFIFATVGSYPLTLTVTNKSDAACAATDSITVTVGPGVPTGSLGNSLRAVKSTSRLNVDLTWPATLLSPDRANLHRATIKTDLDKTITPYRAPIVNVVPIVGGATSDLGVVRTPPALYVYEAFGRDCSGASVLQ